MRRVNEMDAPLNLEMEIPLAPWRQETDEMSRRALCDLTLAEAA
jgi:hypothetical protein